MPVAKFKKNLLYLLIFFISILVVGQVLLLYQKGYFKYGFLKAAKQISILNKSRDKVLPVLATSDISVYSLKIVDPKLLNQYLGQFGFVLGKSLLVFGEEKPQEIKELVVHLTDKEQPFLKAKVGDKVVYSVGNTIREGKLDLFIQIGDDLRSEGVDLGFDRIFLQGIYTIANNNANPDQQGFENLFKKFRDKNYSLFKITKAD